MDRLIKPDLQELYLAFNRGHKCSATFQLTNLMHTMSVAISLTTTNPSVFSFSQPFSIIPPLKTSSFTLYLSQSLNHPPLSSPLDTILVRSSMLPTGKAHQDDLRRLFSKPGPHIFKDATIPVAFVGPHVVEALIQSPSPKSLEIAFLLSKAIAWCDRFQLNSLLGIAAKSGSSYFISYLIDAGADVNSRDADGESAMSLAVKSENIDSVQVLIESDYRLDNFRDRFFHDAVEMNRLDLMKLLCLGYVDIEMNSIDSHGRTPLHLAAIRGNVQVIQFLVSAGSDADVVDDKGWTPLHYAATGGNLEAVLVLSNRATMAKYALTRDRKTPYDLAVENNHLELFDVLHLGDAMHRAARTDDVEEIKNCIARGANVNSKDQNGWSPLHRAAFKGQIESVKILIGHGAKVDMVDDIGYTPLHLAVEGGHCQVALYLVAHGAKCNLKSLEAVIPQDLNCLKNHHPSSLVK